MSQIETTPTPYTTETESLRFINDPLYDYRLAAERNGINPTPTSLVALIGKSASRLWSLLRT